MQYFDATQDASFLHEKLLPLLRGVADFYLSYAVSSASAIFGPFGVRHGAPSSERSLPFTCAQEVCHGGGGGARNGPLKRHCLKRSFYQDRLGTNLGKLQGKRGCLSSAQGRSTTPTRTSPT